MARPLFEIARDIASDWQIPTHQAKTYLKSMYYLLGMDDLVADLDAKTAVRLFLLYAKEWTGPTADRIKAELTTMRLTNKPTNADLLASNRFAAAALTQASCGLCDASLGAPAKFVEAHTHWQARARMCQHCALFLSPGVDLGDGAVFIADSNGVWRHLHGEPTPAIASAQAATLQADKSAPKPAVHPKMRHVLKLLGRRAIRKCATLMRKLFRKSA